MMPPEGSRKIEARDILRRQSLRIHEQGWGLR